MTEERRLVPFNEEMLFKVLEIVGQDAVLVGGKALAVWVGFYEIQLPSDSASPNAKFSVGDVTGSGAVAISADSDFMGDRELVARLASRFANSSPHFQLRSALSSLHGVVELHLDDANFMSIDIIQSVAGIDNRNVWDRSISLETPSHVAFRVLHPLDLLRSRVYNIAHFPEKQNDNGRMQLRLALQVANRYIRDTKRELGEKTALKQIEEVVAVAKSSAGRAARYFGADYRVALPNDAIASQKFHEIRWVRILKELDAAMPQAYFTWSPAADAQDADDADQDKCKN